MNRKIVWALGGICLLRVAMVAGFLCDTPPIFHNGWIFHQGGGHETYFAMAQSFVAVQPIKYLFPVGYPLLLSPLAALADVSCWQDFMPYVVLFQTALALISIIVVYALTNIITK